MTEMATLLKAIEVVRTHETSGATDQALIVLSIWALMAAIGEIPDYRERYVAKGGTVLRLRRGYRLERVSTDLDLSDLAFSKDASINHAQFSAEMSRAATEILRRTYANGDAGIVVDFIQDDERDPTGDDPIT